MSQKARYLTLLAGVAAVAVVWRTGILTDLQPGHPAEVVSVAAPVPNDPSATRDGVPATVVAGSEAAAQATPSFDVVRVAPDGGAVVAGRAKPGAAISLKAGEQVLAQVTAGAGGEFAMDLTLPQGEHRLSLETQRTADATAGSKSSETVVVNVPTADRANELLVMVEREGQPSEVLVRPSPATPIQNAAAELIRPVSNPAPEFAAPSSSGAAAPESAELAVEAVEIEGGQLFVAGRAAPGAKLKVYMDDRHVADAEGKGGRFVASAKTDIPVGDHAVRADQVTAGGAVVARVEVPFNRPTSGDMGAIAPLSGEPVQAAETGGSDVPASVQPALETVEGRVIIRRGDTLWRISRETYGQGRRYTVIYLANGDQIRNPDLIYPGQVFRMPKDG